MYKLRELLPEFIISKDGVLYDFKRQDKNGKWIHIPLLKADSTWMARVIKEVWEDNYA